MKTGIEWDRGGLLVRGLAVGALACALAAAGVVASLDRAVGDLLVRIAVSRPPPPLRGAPDAAVVAIDPRSLRAFPSWPWARRLHAEAVRQLDAAGARAIAFDIDFSTPRDLADDAAFARAIADSGRVVLAAFRQRQRLDDGSELEIANVPAAPFESAAGGIGSVLVRADGDGVVRRAPRATEIAARPVPTLAAAALATALDSGAPSELHEGLLRIDYRRARPAFPVLSIADVIEGRFDPRDVAGRVVFVGATAAEFQDLWTTPLGPAVPGVFIQATLYRTLAAETLGHAPLRTPPRGALLAALLLLSLLAAPLGGLGPLSRVAAVAAGSLCLLLACAGLASGPGLLVSPVLPVAVVGSHYVLGLEVVRRRIDRRVAAQDSSLLALAQVGHAATQGRGEDLSLALRLLGDVVGASAVALLRAGEDGQLDGSRLEWSREDGRAHAAIGDPATAAAVLAERATRVVEAAVAGPGRSGLAVYCALASGETPEGVLVVECEGRESLDEMQLRTIGTVGAQLALSAGNLRLLENLRHTFATSITAVASAVEARDGYTDLHCRRLAAFSRMMAERLGMSPLECEAIELGALLHDVGKIGIRDQILLKPGRFDPEERREMERHPEIGERIVGGIHGLDETTLACVRHHHERWDGSGYPDGLAGEEIPVGARIVSVVDVWDALSSSRPYKGALPQEQVLELLSKGRGVQFDPALVDLFLRILDEQGEEMLALIGRDDERGRS